MSTTTNTSNNTSNNSNNNKSFFELNKDASKRKMFLSRRYDNNNNNNNNNNDNKNTINITESNKSHKIGNGSCGGSTTTDNNSNHSGSSHDEYPNSLSNSGQQRSFEIKKLSDLSNVDEINNENDKTVKNLGFKNTRKNKRKTIMPVSFQSSMFDSFNHTKEETTETETLDKILNDINKNEDEEKRNEEGQLHQNETKMFQRKRCDKFSVSSVQNNSKPVVFKAADIETSKKLEKSGSKLVLGQKANISTNVENNTQKQTNNNNNNSSIIINTTTTNNNNNNNSNETESLCVSQEVSYSRSSFSSNNYNSNSLSNSTNEGQTKKPRQQFTLGKRTGEPKKVGFLSVQKPKEDVIREGSGKIHQKIIEPPENLGYRNTGPSGKKIQSIVPQELYSNCVIPSKEELLQNKELKDDVDLFAFSQQKWLTKNMEDQLNYYCTCEPFTIGMLTWNIDQNIFDIEILNQWAAIVDDEPDIIIFGLQEMDMTVEAMVYEKIHSTLKGAQTSQKADEYSERLYKVVNRNHSEPIYDKFQYLQLCGIVLFMFTKNTITYKIKNIYYGFATAGGYKGKIANKGGVAVRMEINDTSLCIVNSHLAAHEAYKFVVKREEDWWQIASTTTFLDIKTGVKYEQQLLDHDIVLWMGDLNYRIDNMTYNEVLEKVKEQDWQYLRDNDQLTKERLAGRVFPNFYEAKTLFPPTFKVNPEKIYVDNRIPSWCDRVLYKSLKQHGVEYLKYQSHELYTSDHKPVSALLKVYTQIFDFKKKERAYQFLQRISEVYKLFTVSTLTIETTLFTFENVEWGKKYYGEIIISNSGLAKTHIKYFKDEDINLPFYPYIHVPLDDKGDPIEYDLDIDGPTQRITIPFYIQFDKNSAMFFQDKTTLENKTVIKFIDIHGNKYQVKCIIKTVKSIIGLDLVELRSLNTFKGEDFPKHLEKLKDIMVDHNNISEIFDENKRYQSIFSNEFSEVIKALENDDPLPQVSIHVITDVYLILLRSLKNPIITSGPEIEKYKDNKKDAKKYIQMVNKQYGNSLSLLYLKNFERIIELGNHFINRGLDWKTVCKTLSNVLFRAPLKYGHSFMFSEERFLQNFLNIEYN